MGFSTTLIKENYILVTNNARDFLKLCTKEEIHPGLVIIVPGGILPSRQVQLFDLALDEIEKRNDMVNMVLAVDKHGTVSIRNYP